MTKAAQSPEFLAKFYYPPSLHDAPTGGSFDHLLAIGSLWNHAVEIANEKKENQGAKLRPDAALELAFKSVEIPTNGGSQEDSQYELNSAYLELMDSGVNPRNLSRINFIAWKQARFAATIAMFAAVQDNFSSSPRSSLCPELRVGQNFLPVAPLRLTFFDRFTQIIEDFHLGVSPEYIGTPDIIRPVIVE